MLFGTKTEKIPLVDEEQLTLFDIPEKEFPIAKEDEEVEVAPGYNFLKHVKDITHVGCWAHSRRKFIDVTKAESSKKKKKGKAHEALKYIRKLYKIEKKAKEKALTPGKIRKSRART